MNALVVIRAISIVCTGLAAGIFLGHRVGVSRARLTLSPSSFVQLQQIIHVPFSRMMPLLILGSVGATVSWTILLWARWQTAEFWLVAGAALAMVCAVGLTRAVNIPINNKLMTWSFAAPPADLAELWAPWERVHSIRTALALVAFSCEVVAVSILACRIAVG